MSASHPQAGQSVAAEAAEVLLDPTAPGTPTQEGIIVDLPEVLPDTAGSGRLILWVGMGSGVAFAALAAAVGAHAVPVGTVDGTVHLWVITHREPGNISLAQAITWGGSTMVALPLLAVIAAFAVRGPTRLMSRIGSAALLTGIASLGVYLGLVINHLMGGVRPDEVDWAGDAGGPTFPSGHTTMATVFAACCVWALAPRMNSRFQLVALCSAGVLWAGLVGLSRVWLGVHWPSDVVGGWLFGLSWTTLAASVLLVARRRWPKIPLRHTRS